MTKLLVQLLILIAAFLLIDKCKAQSPSSYKEVVEILKKKGFDVKDSTNNGIFRTRIDFPNEDYLHLGPDDYTTYIKYADRIYMRYNSMWCRYFIIYLEEKCFDTYMSPSCYDPKR